MVNTRLLVALPIYFLSLSAVADPVPYVFESAGAPSSVVYDYRGIQARHGDFVAGKGVSFNPGTFEFSPETASAFIQKAAGDWSAASGGSPNPARIRFSLHRADQQAGGIAGKARIIMTTPGFVSLTIPKMDAGAKDPAFMTASLGIDDFTLDGLFPVTKDEKTLVKSQKAWIPNNFRFEINGMDTGGLSIDPLTITAADLDGDGFPDVLATTDLVVKGSVLSSSAYADWFAGAGTGVDNSRTCRYQMFTASGMPCGAVQMTVSPVSLGPTNIFSYFEGTDGTFTLEMKTGKVKFFNDAKGFG